MKYNTTYTPITSLKDTVKKTEYVIREIENFYKGKYNITKIIAPAFLGENSELLISINEITRPITFDVTDEYKIGQMILSYTNWMRMMASKLSLNNNEGIYSETTSIWRDLEINPISSVIKNHISFQIVIDKKRDIKKIVKKETDILYSLISDFEKEFSKEFKFKKIFPESPTYVTSQMLANEFPNVDFKRRENDMADELNGYILSNPGDKLFSGHIHSVIPIELYATKNFNQILLKDFVNSSVLKVASVSQLATGQLLADQLSLSNKSNLKELNFYSDEIKRPYNIIEVKIDIGRLMMSLLKKGHISETQPGNISDETKRISARYKVEEY